MSRVTTGALLLAFAAAISACTKQAGEPIADGSPQPVKNLLVICIDTVRADTFYQLGELKQDRLSTWQEDGLVFTQAASPAPWTVPSIASAFTGLWPKQHGAGSIPGLTKVSLVKSPPSVLRPEVRTIAQEARENGFSTTVISASQWTFDNENPVDISRGFNDFNEYVPDMSTLDFPFWEPMLEQWTRLIDNQAPGERALNFVHFIDAHNWHTGTPGKLKAFISSFSPEQLALYRTTAPAPACKDEKSIICKRYLVYAHAVGVLRNTIADMLDALKERGQLEDTAVIVFSDHGEEFHDHVGEEREQQLFEHAMYFGHGISLYEEQLHVPVVVWHPDLAGAVIHTPVSLIDIAPSAASWLGLEFAPVEGQGRLLHEQLERPEEDNGRVLFASNISIGEKQMSARKGPDKAIWYMASDRIKYFDLEKDPDELQPAVAQEEMVLAFDGRFLEYEQMKQDAQSETASFTKEQIDRLQAIGYLQGVDSDDGEEE